MPLALRLSEGLGPTAHKPLLRDQTSPLTPWIFILKAEVVRFVEVSSCREASESPEIGGRVFTFVHKSHRILHHCFSDANTLDGVGNDEPSKVGAIFPCSRAIDCERAFNIAILPDQPYSVPS